VSDKKVPECHELPAVFRLDRDWARGTFEARIAIDRREGWQVYGHCTLCGQNWLVEQAGVYSHESGFAIKIPDPRTWSVADERAARIDFLRLSRGGDAPSGECIVAGCTRRPLRSVAYCAQHTFDLTGARE
jgi:hypothetical protein